VIPNPQFAFFFVIRDLAIPKLNIHTFPWRWIFAACPLDPTIIIRLQEAGKILLDNPPGVSALLDNHQPTVESELDDAAILICALNRPINAL